MLTSRRAPGRPLAIGLIAALAISILPGAPVQYALAVSPDIVISEVYGGGGNAGATYTHDYIELYNRGAASVSLAGNSLQYASATGTGNFGGTATQLTELPAVTLDPGQYFLVQQASNAAVGSPLPTADFVDPTPIAMAAGAGKVAYVTGTTSLGCNGSVGQPCTAEALARIVDLVGYGNANFFEGTAAAPTISATLAAIRAGGGATDTDNNGADFAAGTPDPDSSAEDVAPTVASTVPANGATDVPPSSNVEITFSEPVNATAASFSIACPPGSGALGFTLSGGPTTFTLNPSLDFPANTLCGVTVIASAVTDQDGTPDPMLSSFSFGFTTGTLTDPCEDPFTPIYTIQGSGLTAAITGTVTTAGVVVGDFEGTASALGFYMQDAAGDADAATSDGIFVFTGSSNLVAEGDFVRVTGFARERFLQTTINGSDSNSAAVPASNIVNCGTGSITATDVTLPFESLTFPERFEGMLVRFPQPLVISEYFNYDRFGELVLAQPLPGEDRAFTPTSIVEPGAPAIERALANSLSRITLDDAQSAQNPPILRHPNGDPFSLTNRFRGGDTVQNATGVLGFDFSLYRIFPTAAATYTEVNPRPAAPDPVGGTLRAAAMNTLNFFVTLDYPTGDPLDNKCGPANTLECRGADADQPLELTRQRDKLLAALVGLDADIVGLNEIENSTGAEPLGDPNDGLVAGLNDILGAGTYDFIDTGVIGTDAIRVGLIYKPAMVQPIGDFKILDSSVDPRFIDTRSRPVLTQTFEEVATGARITVAVNHLKSKGSACTGAPLNDPDLGDGQGNCNLTRQAAAQALVEWLATDPTGSGDRDYLILGDLNSYAKEDPIDAIVAGADGIAGTADDYTNLIAKYQGTHAYSFVFDGQAGYLDHALASPTLVGQVTGATEWHINADEPDLLDYDTTFKPPEQDAIFEPNAYRSSDHDPVVVGLNLLSYDFSGFFPPVANPPAVNNVNSGQTVPMRFALNGDLGLDVLFGDPTAARYTCSSGDPTGDVATATGALIFDPGSGGYTYEWKTVKAWANQCRTFTLTLDDGTYRSADFHFRK